MPTQLSSRTRQKTLHSVLTERMSSARGRVPLFKEREVWQIATSSVVDTGAQGSLPSNFAQLLFRPVLVLRKVSATTFIGLPLTLRQRDEWEKELYGYYPVTVKEKENFVIFSQISRIDAHKLQHKMTQVSENIFKKIQREFIKYLKVEKEWVE